MIPQPPLLQLRNALHTATPAIGALALLIISALPVFPVRLPPLTTQLAILGVFFWLLYTPTLLPFWLLFTIGICADLLAHNPVGLSPLTLICAITIIRAIPTHLVQQTFFVEWLAFAIVVAAASLIECAIQTLFLQALPPIIPRLFAAGIVTALYPLMAPVYVKLFYAISPANNSPRET